jgi:hypothetical protein
MKSWPRCLVSCLGLVACLAFPLASAAQPAAEPGEAKGEAEGDVAAAVAKAELPDSQHGKPADFQAAIAPLLAAHCVTCHSGESPKGDLSLEFGSQHAVEDRLRTDRKVFERIAERVRAGEMPPEDRARPNDAETSLLLSWIDRDLLKIGSAGSQHVGQVASPSSRRTTCRRTTVAMGSTTSPIC